MIKERLEELLIILVRIHKNRVQFDWGGWLQWKPVGTKNKIWYTVHQGAFEPLEMRDRIQNEIENMKAYHVALEIDGEWDRSRKVMIVSSVSGLVG